MYEIELAPLVGCVPESVRAQLRDWIQHVVEALEFRGSNAPSSELSHTTIGTWTFSYRVDSLSKKILVENATLVC